jgi:inner membrane transporter RhtA
MARSEAAAGSPARRVPATVLVLASIASVQAGAAFAKSLFDQLGSGGAVFLRGLGAAVVLLAVWRPRLDRAGRSRREWVLIGLFALAQTILMWAFYAAIDRIPLATAVAIEFTGPLGVAVAGSRRLLDLLWVALAAAGVLLLTGGFAGALDPVGVLLAFVAGAGWAAYILLSQRLGRVAAGGTGLALSVAVSTVLLAPVGIAQAGTALLDWRLLLAGAGVGILASVVPFSLEMEALRRLPARVFGVLMSLEPGAAALAGFVLLGETLTWRELAGIACVIVASAGAAGRPGSSS